ncbi:uncharacterized protein BDR25DRAFT_360090 [Lindgomyces ingoldianus]|uniref:Uncharacterized protein n=1 Tax=Lindgomyces ingoldianus TaxID=673940 RepID=A0ACB6QG22_9PLEO|nr:uncharacterized protein BDR25DRAFT_360090 [Lindgomyces ingoldianus]KAF2465928.1 hypothetical protein BDR25DRAFT_360090 [Lindgomyces ingoldianus]
MDMYSTLFGDVNPPLVISRLLSLSRELSKTQGKKKRQALVVWMLVLFSSTIKAGRIKPIFLTSISRFSDRYTKQPGTGTAPNFQTFVANYTHFGLGKPNDSISPFYGLLSPSMDQYPIAGQVEGCPRTQKRSFASFLTYLLGEALYQNLGRRVMSGKKQVSSLLFKREFHNLTTLNLRSGVRENILNIDKYYMNSVYSLALWLSALKGAAMLYESKRLRQSATQARSFLGLILGIAGNLWRGVDKVEPRTARRCCQAIQFNPKTMALMEAFSIDSLQGRGFRPTREQSGISHFFQLSIVIFRVPAFYPPLRVDSCFHIATRTLWLARIGKGSVLPSFRLAVNMDPPTAEFCSLVNEKSVPSLSSNAEGHRHEQSAEALLMLSQRKCFDLAFYLFSGSSTEYATRLAVTNEASGVKALEGTGAIDTIQSVRRHCILYLYDIGQRIPYSPKDIWLGFLVTVFYSLAAFEASGTSYSPHFLMLLARIRYPGFKSIQLRSPSKGKNGLGRVKGAVHLPTTVTLRDGF